MKVAVITCCSRPDDVRTQKLGLGFSMCKNVEVRTVKNSKIGLGRYREVISQTYRLKRDFKPDLYVLTYRSYEMLPFVALISGRKPIVYDEYINPLESMSYERHKISPEGGLAKLIMFFYRLSLRRCRFVLTDNSVHAEFSAKINKLSLDRYKNIAVGTDEKNFQPSIQKTHKAFKVFYSSSSLLNSHGLVYVLGAAEQLKGYEDIEFLISGYPKDAKKLIMKAAKSGARIKFGAELGNKKLRGLINSQDLCLGGPFGNSVQSRLVITDETYQFMACAKATVIGRTKIKAKFIDEKNCLVVTQGSSRALATKIMWAYSHKTKLAAIGSNAHKTYNKFFSNEAVMTDCQALLDEL